jgi:hypothetical protein
MALSLALYFGSITLCSDEDIILIKLRESFRHLERCGYTSERLLPLFHAAIKKARAYDGTATTMIANTNPSSFLLKLAYHPWDPPSSFIQRLWRDEITLPSYDPALPLSEIRSSHNQMKIGLDRIIVCYRRSSNLGNLVLSYRHFAFQTGPPVSSYFED